MIYILFVPVFNHRKTNASRNFTERETSDHFGVSIIAKQSTAGKHEVLYIDGH